MTINLVIPGTPKGKGRPRFGKGHAFTPKETVQAENRIVEAWIEAGEVYLEGAIYIDLHLFHQRPAAHFTTRGLLSTAGKRAPIPINKKPDVDNALKLVMDALNGHAWKDDVQVVRASVMRWWAPEPSTVIRALSRELPGAVDESLQPAA